MVADALSPMTMGSVSHIEKAKKYLVRYAHRLFILGVRLEDTSNGGFMVLHKSESPLVVQVKYKQHLDQLLMELKEQVFFKYSEAFFLRWDGVLRYQGRLCVPNVNGLRKRILEKYHGPVTQFIWVRQE